ncbi:MAG: cellulase family glycosylhydrolase [Myxococcota bacterium]|nr:cellulase family glycosylhydrolase [Myxococcota bacterium]
MGGSIRWLAAILFANLAAACSSPIDGPQMAGGQPSREGGAPMLAEASAADPDSGPREGGYSDASASPLVDGGGAIGAGDAAPTPTGLDDGAVVAIDSGSAGDTGGQIGSAAAASDGGMNDAAPLEGGTAMTFITRKGLTFDDGGKRYVFVGTNFWPGMNLGVASVGDPARLVRELDRLKMLGITNVRLLASSQGPDTEPYRVMPALVTQPGTYNEEVFRGLDRLLDELAKRGMRAVMVLNNYWEWSGGMAQYVSWANKSKIPYRLAPGGNYATFVMYVDGFYGCSACQTEYRANVAAIVHRVNTLNGRMYRDDPVIFSWQLANEPRDYPPNWINDTAQYVKSIDPNHLVSVGSEGTWAADFVTTHQSPFVDYTTCHIWVENWGKYDPNDASGTSLASATAFATGYLRANEMAARQLGKPLVLEEFGLARDGWSAGGKFDPAATVTHRDAYYQSLYEVVIASLGSGQGALAGDSFWAWGGEARPPSRWAGDPPHETSGWYSVYDADRSTTALIASHASAVKAFAR